MWSATSQIAFFSFLYPTTSFVTTNIIGNFHISYRLHIYPDICNVYLYVKYIYIRSKSYPYNMFSSWILFQFYGTKKLYTILTKTPCAEWTSFPTAYILGPKIGNLPMIRQPHSLIQNDNYMILLLFFRYKCFSNTKIFQRGQLILNCWYS